MDRHIDNHTIAPPRSLRGFIPAALFLLIGVAIYSNTLHSPFVFDDGPSITRNPTIKNLQNFYGNSTGYDKYPNRFVGYATFALNYRFGAFDPSGYHVVNLAIHIGNALLVYFIVLITFRTPYMEKSFSEKAARGSALTAGLLFLVHPVQTEAVTFIVQRLTSLATAFFLLSLFYYAKARLLSYGGPNPSKKKYLPCYLVSFLFCLLSMKTKEISFTLPVILLVYEGFFFDGPFRKRAFLVFPFLLSMLVIPLSLVNVHAPIGKVLTDIGTATRVQTDLSRGDYFLTELSVIVTYVRLLFLPIHQNLDYDYPIYRTLLQPRVILCAAFLAFLLGTALRLYLRSRKNGSATLRVISFGMIWFFVTLAVESSLVPIVDVIFEHRIYLPSVGAFLSLAAAASMIPGGWKRKAWTAALILIVAGLSAGTYTRNMIWEDDLILWSDNVKKSPAKARPHYNLGNSYFMRRATDKAIREFQEAIRLDPGYADAYLNLGVAYASTGADEKAMTALNEATRLNPADPESHYNLGLLYANKGSDRLAVEHYQRAISLQPESVNARNNLGILLAASGRIDEAIDQFRQGLRYVPGDEELRRNLENAYRLKSRSK